jgi:uncharacterized protein YgiM (DUF1202 family)
MEEFGNNMFNDFGVEAETVSVKIGEKTFVVKRGGQYGLYKVTLERARTQPINGNFTSVDDAKVAIHNYANTNLNQPVTK